MYKRIGSPGGLYRNHFPVTKLHGKKHRYEVTRATEIKTLLAVAGQVKLVYICQSCLSNKSGKYLRSPGPKSAELCLA